MQYLITVKNSKDFINRLYKCLNGEDKKDQQGHEIDTWKAYYNTKGLLVLVHTKEQWEKCCIRLSIPKSCKDNTLVEATFVYFDTTKTEDRNDFDEGTIYGRFTELLLNHFKQDYKKIEVEAN